MGVGSEVALVGHVNCTEMMRDNPEAVSAHPWSIFLTTSGRSPALFDAVPSDYRFRSGDTVWVDGRGNLPELLV